jgi:uncharacterized membrane protein
MPYVQSLKSTPMFDYVFIVVLVAMLIGSAVGLFFIGGYTVKILSMCIMGIGAFSVVNGINHNFFIKEKDKDERVVSIRNKAKAKAFNVMEIVFGILICIYVLLKENLLTISLVIVAYLVFYAVYMVYISKYHKEM